MGCSSFRVNPTDKDLSGTWACVSPLPLSVRTGSVSGSSMTAFGSLKRSLFIPALSPLQGGRALPRLASPRPLENLWGQTAAQKIAAVAPSPQEPTAQHTAHDLPTCAVGLSHPGLASPGDRPEIGRGAGPAARALRKTNRGRGPAGRSGLRLAGMCRGVSEGGGPRVERQAAGVEAARGAPESRRPGRRSWASHRFCRHEPLQGVQIPAYGGPAAPS